MLVTMVAVALLVPNRVHAQLDELYEKPPLSYSSAKPHDAVAELEARSGSVLSWTGGGKVILQRLLKELHIPVESQVLVFSKTSFQRQVINPRRPRAIYFSDTSYVGWACWPREGAIFFNPTEDYKTHSCGRPIKLKAKHLQIVSREPDTITGGPPIL